MAKSKMLTLSDLIAKKIGKEKEQKKAVFVESLGGELVIEALPEDVMFKALDMVESGTNFSETMAAYDYMIYNAISMLRNPELHAAYEVVNPTDIVGKLLQFNERLELGEEVFKVCGLDKIGEKVKN